MLQWPRPSVMGILNVTPDSFSDGGQFFDARAAIDRGRALAEEGADIIDVGGESTRPGAGAVALDEELRRVIPVIEGLAASVTVPLSVDTTKAAVAAAAIDAGATVVNDVSAGRFDPAMLELVAERGVTYVVMHMQGDPRTMQGSPHYDDVVSEVVAFLVDRLGAARAADVAPDRLWADPGIGFGKTLDHNLALLAHLDDVVGALDVPVLVGTSRKSFIGTILGTDVGDRDDGTLATVAWAFSKGASTVRVHDVRSAARTARLFDVMGRATQHGVPESTETGTEYAA